MSAHEVAPKDEVGLVLRNGTWVIGEVITVNDWGFTLEESFNGYGALQHKNSDRLHAVAWRDVFTIWQPDADGVIHGLQIAFGKDLFDEDESA